MSFMCFLVLCLCDSDRVCNCVCPFCLFHRLHRLKSLYTSAVGAFGFCCHNAELISNWFFLFKLYSIIFICVYYLLLIFLLYFGRLIVAVTILVLCIISLTCVIVCLSDLSDELSFFPLDICQKSMSQLKKARRMGCLTPWYLHASGFSNLFAIYFLKF